MEERMENTQNTKKKGGLAALAVIGAIAAVYLLFCTYAYLSPKIYPNTKLAGVNYGGMSPEQAEWKLASVVTQGREEIVAFELQDGTPLIEVKPDAKVDVSDAVRAIAAQGGAEDGFFDGGVNFVLALLKENGPVYYSGADAALAPAADKVFDALACDVVEFSGAMTETGITFTKAMDGRVVREGEVAREYVLSALRHALFSGTTTYATLNEGVVYDLVPAQEVDLASFRRSVVGGKSNAYYDIETEAIVPETRGVTMTLEQLTTMYEAAKAGETFSFEVPVNEPEVTAEMLEEGLFRDKLATYTTYAYGPAGRQTNVRLAAERCNGTILNAGDVFDYSKTLGPVTPATGFQPAPGYVHGKTVDVNGGGICQVSSTIYATALHANLEIVERHAHGFASSYIGLGLDATVADGGPQFKLRNNTLYPIKIETIYAKNNNVTVNIWGTKTDDTYVKMVSEVLEKTPYGEVIEETDTLPPGERKVDQDPYTGYKVNTYRCVYAGDGTLLSREFEAYSRYKMRDRLVLVGKAVEQPVVPEQVTETPTEAPTETPAETPVETPVEPAPPADTPVTEETPVTAENPA